MIRLLLNGEVDLFILMVIALIISLTFHEFGHALVAKLYGDRTAEQAGRLTLNPIAHIDPLGLLMVMFVGFGYAKPVPTNPRNFKSAWASPMVAFAGPGMNLLLAIVSVNLFFFGLNHGFEYFNGAGQRDFFIFLAQINLLLMIFNLIPLGSLDGHYILPHLLPTQLAYRYTQFNAAYGNMILLGLIALSLIGVPIFNTLLSITHPLMSLIVFTDWPVG